MHIATDRQFQPWFVNIPAILSCLQYVVCQGMLQLFMNMYASTYRNVTVQTIYGKGVTGDEVVAETTTVEVSGTCTISRIKTDGDSEPVCKLRTQLLYQTHLVVCFFVASSPGPGPTKKNQEKGLVTLAKIPVCAVSAVFAWSRRITFDLCACMARGKVIGRVLLSSLSVCPSVCLLAQKMPVLQIQAILLVLNTSNCAKLSCLCFFLLDTLYKHLKSSILSWHRGHAYRPHPDTWPPVQRGMMVSVFLGFTIQRAFVRWRFVPILNEAHA